MLTVRARSCQRLPRSSPHRCHPRDEDTPRATAPARCSRLRAIGLLVPLALAATGIYDRFNVRNVLYLWPLFAALAAPALLRLRAVPLAALLALGIATSLWTQTDWRYGNTDWRAIVERIAARRAERAGVIAVTTLGQPVAALYLDRIPIDTPAGTRHAWLVVEPTRSAGHRDLRPADPPLVAQLLAAFPHHEETVVNGFRLIELSAPADVTIDPAQLPGAALLPPAG